MLFLQPAKDMIREIVADDTNDGIKFDFGPQTMSLKKRRGFHGN
jgi:hypothetical protein